MTFAITILACGSDQARTSSGTDSQWPDSSAPDSGSDTGLCPNYTGDIYIGVNDSLCAFPTAPAAWGVRATCDDGAKAWVYDFYTVGVPDEAILRITETSDNAWEEEQPIPMHRSDPDFYWAEFYTMLPIVTDWQDVQEGTNTLYGCELEGQMTWGLYVYNGGSMVECAAWGDDPALFAGCGNWN